jgi:hypothetical protein
MRRVIWFSFLVVILTTVSDWRSAASAKVIRLEIASKAYYGSFKPGDYELWEGRIIGELSPGESIPNIDKATRNARGADCKLPVARLDWSPISRATLLRLDDWIVRNAEPPANQLMPLEPSRDDPDVLRAPAHFATAIVQVPQRDADGNSLGGVRLPDLSVPLGVHGLQNQPLSRGCMLVGSYRPFAKTREERERAHDQRPSVAERYRDRNDYVNRIRNAARQLATAGFLLPDDEAIIVHSAAETSAFK